MAEEGNDRLESTRVALTFLALFGGHSHYKRGCLIGSFDQLHAFDDFAALGLYLEIPQLLRSERKRTLRTPNICMAQVIGEMNAIHKRMVFDCTIDVVQANDHRYRAGFRG